MKWQNTKHIKFTLIDQWGEEITKELKGANIEAVVPRNTKYHNWVMAIIRWTMLHMKPSKAIREKNIKDFLLVFKQSQEMYDLKETPWGEVKEYHSISFNSMDQIEFSSIVPRIFDFCHYILTYGPHEFHELLEMQITGEARSMKIEQEVLRNIIDKQEFRGK